MPDTLTPLATSDAFLAFGSFATLVRDFDPTAIDTLMLRATRAVESRCDRRFAPFTITETTRADGIDPAFTNTVGMPLDTAAALSRSRSQALGVTSLVRDVWLHEYAPLYTDLWAYSNVSVVLARALGDTQSIGATTLEGPEVDTGHFRFRLGTFIPPGTTVRVTYSGGYQTVPYDLEQAAIFQSAKLAILSAEPQSRSGMSLDELDMLILELLAPFIRS